MPVILTDLRPVKVVRRRLPELFPNLPYHLLTFAIGLWVGIGLAFLKWGIF